jgi:hypothetical protein
MGLPSTVRGRFALAGFIVVLYIVGATLYTSRRYPYFTRPEPQTISDSNIGSPESTPPAAPAKVLLVTSWLPVHNPQFTVEDYAQWLPNFFGSNRNDVYIYTTPQHEHKFRSLRGNNLSLIIDTRFTSPFDIPPLKGKEDLYKNILKKDRAKSKASIDLYANRHAKPFFLYDAVSRLERPYDFAFWSDAGSFREKHVYTQWPSLSRLQEIWDAGSKLSDTLKEDLVFIPSSRAPHTSMKFWTEAMGPIDNDLSIGSFFGGPPNALDWFTRVYYAYHDHYLSFEIFIGKNQALINSLLFLFPKRFLTVWANQPYDGSEKAIGQCGANLRFYYEFWLAGSEERRAMVDLWIREASAWRWWGWWNRIDKTPCVTREVLGMETVIRSNLGTEWKPPGRTVEIPEKVTLDS